MKSKVPSDAYFDKFWIKWVSLLFTSLHVDIKLVKTLGKANVLKKKIISTFFLFGLVLICYTCIMSNYRPTLIKIYLLSIVIINFHFILIFRIFLYKKKERKIKSTSWFLHKKVFYLFY